MGHNWFKLSCLFKANTEKFEQIDKELLLIFAHLILYSRSFCCKSKDCDVSLFVIVPKLCFTVVDLFAGVFTNVICT